MRGRPLITRRHAIAEARGPHGSRAELQSSRRTSQDHRLPAVRVVLLPDDSRYEAGGRPLDFESAIVQFGTEAVLRYRAVAEPRHDNELPESFLRNFVALRFHEQFGKHVHVERLYTAMVLDLGLPLSPDLVTVLAGFRADLAVYEDGKPVAIIALKVFDAASPLPSMGAEVDKAQILARLAKLQVFVGVMICPIIVSLEARIERLHDAFGGNMYVGERQHSRDQTWQWCFACASLGGSAGARSY
jgi:hypothetical protein